MDKEKLQSLLKEITPSAKLPSRMDFEVSDANLFIKISEKGVIANMQEDSSAFEGWAVVIKAALPEIKRVILNWKDPKYNPQKENAQKAHYNRFLMRVANFRRGYVWFDVDDHRKAEVDKMQNLLDSQTLVVNFPKSQIRPVTDKEKKREACLERMLVERWSKKYLITDEQLPVGLFISGEVSKVNTLTPRGASQIDLWQLYDRTMHIYELKVEGNETIGIISELMFYVCTTRHIVNGLIKYPDLTKAKLYRHLKDFASAVKNKEIDRVVGYFTAAKFHPLIEKQRDAIKNILNDNTLGIVFDYKVISGI